MVEQGLKDLVQILARSNICLPFLLKYTLCDYCTPIYSATVCMFVQNLHNKHTGNPMEYDYDNISEFHF